MSEPITLYPIKGGTPLVTAAPSYAADLVKAGHYSRTPVEVDGAPAPDVTVEADEKSEAEKPKTTVKARAGRKVS